MFQIRVFLQVFQHIYFFHHEHKIRKIVVVSLHEQLDEFSQHMRVMLEMQQLNSTCPSVSAFYPHGRRVRNWIYVIKQFLNVWEHKYWQEFQRV